MTKRNSHEFTVEGIIERMREIGTGVQYVQMARQFHVPHDTMRAMLIQMAQDGLIICEQIDRRKMYGLTSILKKLDRRAEPREPFYMRPELKSSYWEAMANFRAGCEAHRR